MNDEFITSMHTPGSANDFRYFEPAPPRELYRPRISALAAVTAALAVTTAVLASLCGAYLICKTIGSPYTTLVATLAPIAVFLAIAVFSLKHFMIWCVLVYQHRAPDDVRLRCLYTPSCSEYMIMSIMKYGTIRGTIRGIKRLKRCHYPNGGHDYP